MSEHCSTAHSESGIAIVTPQWKRTCLVGPSPELLDRWEADLERARGRGRTAVTAPIALARGPRGLGFDDGVIIPPDEFPLGTPESRIKSAAADRAPLRGTVRVIVILVDFSDKQMAASAQHFKDLFFSTGVIPTGSVKEYFKEATNGLIDLTGEVAGVFRMPQTLAWYANSNSGVGNPGDFRSPVMARDAATAANPTVDFGPYDNDGNGFVDAFIVVHAGSGAEQTGSTGDIWSHKSTLATAFAADTTKIFGYLTIPEDAKIGVCAHELGHLLFGFPDLYDTDNSSAGVGRWCLMGAGSWNGGGDTPAHPSAWCKTNQGWVSVTNVTTDGPATIPDVKISKNVLRMWKDGGGGPEYFLVENRQRTGFDSQLPGDGIVVWHIDENQHSNTDEKHYKVGVVQADGKADLEMKRNRGDAGDTFPGSASVSVFTDSTTPNSKSFAGQSTCVSIAEISASAATMTAKLAVHCGKAAVKDLKDATKEFKEFAKELKDARKEIKEAGKELKDFRKEGKELKEFQKEGKEIKEFQKEGKELKEFQKEGKEIKEFKEGGKDFKEIDRPGLPGGLPFPAGAPGQPVADLIGRVEALEAAVFGPVEPFITADLRPDLYGAAPVQPVTDERTLRMAAGDRNAKRELDSPLQ